MADIITIDGKARLNLVEAAAFLNTTAKTIRRYLDSGLLEWSGNQVSCASIYLEYLRKGNADDAEEVQVKQVAAVSVSRRRIISKGI